MTSCFDRYSRLLCCCILTLCLSACQEQLNPKLKAFQSAFIAANQAPSIEPMLALYETQESDAQSLRLLKSALLYELGLPIKAISFEPLSGAPEETIHYTHQGVTYGPSHTPEMRMRVTYDLEDQLTSLFSIGKNSQGTWKIVAAKPLSLASD